MSGPKGYGYSVVSAEELRRREDAARSGRCDQHVITLAGLIGQLRHLGVATPKEVVRPSKPTHDALIAWEKSLEKAIAEAEKRVADESAKAILRRLNATREAVDVTGVSLGGARTRPTTGAGRPARHPALEQVAGGVTTVVTLVAGLHDPAERDALTAMAETILGTTNPAQAQGDLLTLKTRVTNARRVQECREQAAQAVLEVAGIESPEADLLRERAAEALTPGDVTALRGAVRSLAERAARDADATYVRRALEDVVAELGFSVAEGFSLTKFGAVGVAEHADHPGYGLRLQVNPTSGQLLTRVVADGVTTAEADARAERETCEKVHAVAAGLARHGVATDLTVERQPGEVPVLRREAGSTKRNPATPRRTRRTADAKERAR